MHCPAAGRGPSICFMAASSDRPLVSTDRTWRLWGTDSHWAPHTLCLGAGWRVERAARPQGSLEGELRTLWSLSRGWPCLSPSVKPLVVQSLTFWERELAALTISPWGHHGRHRIETWPVSTLFLLQNVENRLFSEGKKCACEKRLLCWGHCHLPL